MNPKFLILPPEIRPTETCVKNCQGHGIVKIFRELCLGTIDIQEREKLCRKIQNQVTTITKTLDKSRRNILNHYINCKT